MGEDINMYLDDSVVFLDAQASPAPTSVSRLAGWLVRHTFRFPLCQCVWSVLRPGDVIWFLKADF